MKTFIYSLLTIITINLSAQAPGYMGKKLSVSYSPTLSVAFYDLGDDYRDIPSVGINLRHDFEAEYVLGRGLSLSPGIKFIGTKMFQTQINDDGSSYEEAGFIGDVKIKSTGFSLKLKNYSFKKRGSIAPVGKYKSFELVLIRSKAETLRFYDYFDNGGSPTYFIENTVEDYNFEINKAFGVVFGGGSQNIYFDKLLIDTGWELGLVIPHLFTDTGANTGGYAYSEEGFSDLVNARIAGTYFLNFTFGFGYLIL
ncbi:MAG: hypothetical protein H7Y00_12370 [Fimbriimonadaceae bacterium]|nr:hypothetical protein [Chitinophagales bacterium]